MKRGEKLWLREAGEWVEATYEFRVTNGEPLGHDSVMLANGGGRRVVCGCLTSTEKPDHERGAFIKDGEIVIRVAVSALPIAIECNPRDYGGEYNHFSKHISDLPEFAKDVVNALNSEAEDGTTLVHTLFDDAIAKAIDNGSAFIDYDAAEAQRKHDDSIEELGGR